MATIPGAWIPALIFGNVFAFFWIFSMVFTVTPDLKDSVKGLFSKNKDKDEKGKDKTGEDDSTKKKPPVTRRNTEMEIQEITKNFKTANKVDGSVSADPPMNPPKAAGLGATQKSVGFSMDGSKDSQQGSAFNDLDLGPEDHPQTIKRRVTRVDTLVIPPVELEWKNIGCTYKTGSTEKTVLEGVYGVVRPTEMMALMGPSGAGKSTLLDILTMRKNVGHLSGEVLMNGHGRQGNFLRMSSYVPQEDNFIPTMTTLETLDFYARLVLPRGTSAKKRKQRVNEVLYMVGLKGAKNTMVGGLLPGGIHLRGLSGGERRRLSIAAGVVSAPSIIFLDEPTSGLDSFAALNVMQYMKSLAEFKSHTVIASIHQPRMSIWNMFDKVVILSKGRMMYSGATSGVVPWFKNKLDYDYRPELHGVISDWVIDLVSIGFSKPDEFYGRTMRNESELLDASEKFFTEYKMLKKSNRGDAELGEGGAFDVSEEEEEEEEAPAVVRKTTTHYVVELPTSHGGASSSAMADMGDLGNKAGGKDLKRLKSRKQPIFNQGYSASWLTQFTTLTWRSYLNVTRNPADVAGRMLTFTYVGAFIGIVFYNLPEGISSVQTKLNIIFNSTSFFMFIPYVSMSLFTSDRQFYSADVTAKIYGTSAYYMANFISNLPFGILNAAVFALIVYGMAGLNDDPEIIFKHVLLAVIESLIALQVLHFAAVITHNQDTAFMVAISFTAVNIIVSNFFIPFKQIALDWISWLQWFSAMGYTFNGAIRLEFDNQNYTCADGLGNVPQEEVQATLLKAFPESGTAISLASSFLENPGEDCVFAGNAILDYFNAWIPYGGTVAILLSYLLILHILTFLGLVFLAKKDKR
ncbi:hypothetical protein BSKO_04384 [Bryopsis sp. KO-2023]|nr:hypothetical protein BSKO_04384 [Bryopsis sp. KO-2023]